MIKVLVCAGSRSDLSRLSAVVRGDPAFQLVGSCLGTAELGEQVASAQPDILLESLGSDDLEELEAAEFAETRFDRDGRVVSRVVLLAESEYAAAWAAIQADHGPQEEADFPDASRGALRGILPVWASETEIRSAIFAVAQGLLILHPSVLERAAISSAGLPQTADSAEAPLSPRELEILNLLATGLGNKEVAWQLKISEHTVKFHVTSIFNKLSVSTRAEAVAVGMRRGLIVL